MKGLTPLEFAMLRRWLTESGDYIPTDAEIAVFGDLVEQGRCRFIATPDHPQDKGYWEITQAGKDILRLWPPLRAALGAA